MWMGKPIDAETALDFGLVSELVPKEKLIERAYEIADHLMSQPRVTRRMTTQVFRRQWKQRIVNDLDGAFGMEMFVDLATDERHTDEKAQAMIDAEGSQVAFLREGRKDG